MSTHMNQDPHTCHSLMRDTASRYTDSRPSLFSGGCYICSHVHTHCPRVYSDLLHNLSTTCIPAQNILQMWKMLSVSIPPLLSPSLPPSKAWINFTQYEQQWNRPLLMFSNLQDTSPPFRTPLSSMFKAALHHGNLKCGHYCIYVRYFNLID